jgi:dihydroxyacid dehydratase/phosphogluconate dehydratase
VVRAAAEAHREAKGLPFAASCTDPCDGRNQGTPGMMDSLPYRNDAADGDAAPIRSLRARAGCSGIATCDKGLPATMLALARLRRPAGRDRARRRDAPADGRRGRRRRARRSARASRTGS